MQYRIQNVQQSRLYLEKTALCELVSASAGLSVIPFGKLFYSWAEGATLLI